MKRKQWIDNLRGICMMAILLLHTDIYYVDNGTYDGILSYNLYVANAIVAFFFLSGYLMYSDKPFDLKRKLRSILRSIVLPYFIFTTIIYIPKNIVHGDGINIIDMLTDIVGGQASWFVTTLALSETIFSLTIYLSKKNTPCIIATAAAGFFLSIVMSRHHAVYPWQADNALQALLFLGAGYLFHKYEGWTDRHFKPFYAVPLFALLLVIKYTVSTQGVSLIIWKINISSYPMFIADVAVSTLLLVELFKLLPNCRLLGWTGRHSLVYYFFCGGVPLVTGKLLRRLNFTYDGNYLRVVAAFIIVYIITSAIVWAVYRYLPFTVGKFSNDGNH